MFAKFIGEDDSMGLKNGNVYEIVLYDFKEKAVVLWVYEKISKSGIPVYYKGACTYSDFKKLAENWEIVRRK